jgi:hypothetical protein
MRITSGGNLQFSGISTLPTDNNSFYSSSSNNYMYIQGGSVGLSLYASGGRNNGIVINETSSAIILNTNNAERMRITSGGNVLIGTTTDAGYKLDVNGGQTRFSAAIAQWGTVFKNNSKCDTYCSHGDGYGIAVDSATNTDGVYLLKLAGGDGGTNRGTTERFKVGGTGNVTTTGTVTASAGFFNSDMRLKDLTDYYYSVSDIKPITYLWKDGRDNKKHVGYSAQEVQKVMPDAVNEDEKGFLSVNYVEVLVAKIAQMEKEIELLKSK